MNNSAFLSEKVPSINILMELGIYAAFSLVAILLMDRYAA